jgi:hypothetical protein
MESTQTFCLSHVKTHLCDQVGNTFEALLIAETREKRDPACCTVEITVESDEMCFDQRVGTLIEGGPPPNRYRRRDGVMVIISVPAGVDAYARNRHGLGHVDIGCRVAELWSTSPIAVKNGAAEFMDTPEESGRLSHVALGD